MKKYSNYLKQVVPIAFAILLISCGYNEKSKTIRKDDLAVDNDTGIVKDIDGNVYHIIKIGEQQWLKENLKVTHFRNGDPITNITNAADWVSTKTAAYCDYNNDPTISADYGRLYNWYAVQDSRNICPQGWHVPTSTEYAALDYTLGGTYEAGGKMKEAGFDHWKYPNAWGTNESGFTGLPGGHRYEDGNFERLGYYAFFWNINETDYDSSYAHECSLNFELSYFNQDSGSKKRGMSVRCIKDN